MPQSGSAFENSLRSSQSALSGYFGAAHTQMPAQVELYEQLGRQALQWAFVDVFRWLALLCFACVILVWFLKKVKPGKAPEGVH
jgi:DHA2 family multidrug resistance protein